MEFSTAILIYSISVSVSSAAIRSTDGVCSEEATRIINAAVLPEKAYEHCTLFHFQVQKEE